MGRYLGIVPSIGSAMVRDNTVQGVMHRSPKSLEGYNSMITCPNEANEGSIGISAKSRCQWTSCLIKKSLN